VLPALLVFKCLYYLPRAGWSLSNLAALLPLDFFTYRAWIA
jgi:hypothetical protein